MKAKREPISIKSSLLAGAAVGLAGVLLAYFNLLGNLERSALDLRFNLRGIEEPADEIVIVGITESCLESLGRWPWDRDIHARLLDLLAGGKAAVIGMDMIIAEPSPDSAMDNALAEATRQTPPVVYSIDAPPAGVDTPGLLTPLQVTRPLSSLDERARAGFINMTPDIDGIMRRFIIWMDNNGEPLIPFAVQAWALWQYDEIEEFDEMIINSFGPGQNHLTLGRHPYPLDGGGRTLINYSGGPGTFPVLPYHLVIEEAYHPSTFQDRIVLVGYYAPGMGDYFFTPLQKDTPMYGIEIHANIVHTLIESGPIYSIPLWFNLLLVFFLGLSSMMLYRLLHPLWAAAGFLVTATLFYAMTMQLFIKSSLYVESVYPLLVLGGSYITALGYRIIAEQRARQRVTRIFGRYVAPQVVEEILGIGEENLKLGGAVREVTVLFVDIRGFTRISETLSPEEVVGILNRYFDLVTRCIFENRGTVDKFMGDAVMALFNAPLHLESHALWAIRAAEEITGKGSSLSNEVKEISGIDLGFGIGINTGYAVVGNIGTENRMEYTAIGDTVNIAARLESCAEPGQVLVSEAVYREVAGHIPLEVIGEIEIKGKSRPVTVYKLASKTPPVPEGAAGTPPTPLNRPRRQ